MMSGALPYLSQQGRCYHPSFGWSTGRNPPSQIQILYCLSQMQRNCASRLTKDGGPAKSLKPTDHYSFSQSMWKFRHTRELTMKHHIRNKVDRTMLKTRVITWKFSDGFGLAFCTCVFPVLLYLTPAVFSVFSLLQ